MSTAEWMAIEGQADSRCRSRRKPKDKIIEGLKQLLRLRDSAGKKIETAIRLGRDRHTLPICTPFLFLS